MFRSKLDRNLEWLNATPERQQALEDGLVGWEENTGEYPSDQELETITIILRRAQSKPYQIYSSIMIALIFATIAGHIIKAFVTTF